MKSEIARILNEQNVRSKLLNLSERFREAIRRRLSVDEQASDIKAGGFDELQWRVIEESLFDIAFEPILRDDVVNRMSLPHAVTERDLRSAVRRFLLSDTTNEQSTYDDFVRHIEDLATRPRVSRPKAVGTCVYLELDRDPQIQVWINDHGFCVTVVGSLPLRLGHSEDDAYWLDVGEPVTAPRCVYVRFSGACSGHAFRSFCRQAAAAMHMCISGVRELNRLHGFEEYVPVALPYALLGHILDVYFSQSARKDSIDRRIRNAVHLMVESHRQRHDAIGLSLSLAAIEALLCDKRDGIAKQLAENVAVLLEPDRLVRGNAINFTKRLYDARSKTLHGARLEHERDDRRRAWVLAFGALRAILQRQEFQRKAGVDVEAPQELFKELYDSMLTGGEIPGVQHSPVRKLWNENLSDAELAKSLRDLRNWSRTSEPDED